ncbi:MAG: hypothetical protein J6Z25_01365 [Opitutales bacterium]|nr:hypothetical protein [Opitutales bacterium]
MKIHNDFLRECTQHALLMQLEAAYPHSLPIKTLKLGLLLSGLPIHRRFLEKELAYLLEKRFIHRVYNQLCPQHHRYQLSTKGIDFLNGERNAYYL